MLSSVLISSKWWVFLLIGLLLVQWPLAMFALSRLFANKPSKVQAILLNIVIVLGIVLAPIVYLIWDKWFKKNKIQQIDTRSAGFEAGLAMDNNPLDDCDDQAHGGCVDKDCDSKASDARHVKDCEKSDCDSDGGDMDCDSDDE